MVEAGTKPEKILGGAEQKHGYNNIISLWLFTIDKYNNLK
jgi:hypothetical protein